MNTAARGDKVTAIYTICLEDGTKLLPLHSGDSVEFTLGDDSVLPGFARAVMGMAQGETKRVFVPAADAYGPYRPERLFRIERSRVMPGLEPLKVGAVVRVGNGEAGDCLATVRELTPSDVLLDPNHPLCGRDITFEIRVVALSPSQSGTPAALAMH